MWKKTFVTIALVIAGLVGTLGLGAVAQTRPASAPAQTSVSAIDRAFALSAGEAATANIRMGQLALERSTSNQVKQFAQAEIAEQMQLSRDLGRVAPRLGIRLPTAPNPKHRAALEQLSRLSGDRFNQAFLDEGGINAHLENAATFQREATLGQNPDLVAIATQGLPTIRQHFATASSLTNYEFARVARRPATPAGTDSPAPEGSAQPGSSAPNRSPQ